MKTSQRVALSGAIISFATLAPSAVLADNGKGGGTITKIPTAPMGTLSATPKVVQTGTKPTLDWSILYPNNVSDVAVINPPGTITLTQNNTYVSVQPIGTGVTSGSSTQNPTTINADARISVNGASYSQLFYGTQAAVDSSCYLYVKKLNAGTTIDFSGRYDAGGTWSSLYTTKSSNAQVISLVNGATPPTSSSLYESSNLASYLKPYLDTSGKIKIGPLSVIVMMELGQTDKNKPSFDYQDMVLLVTFSTGHPNNGHGNNLDGVDSSNPGRGVGGPTGLNNAGLDPSAGVDDERHAN